MIDSRTFYNFADAPLYIGYHGENLVTELDVDMSGVLMDGWGAALWMRRPTQSAAYEKQSNLVGKVLHAVFDSGDTYILGRGEAVIELYGPDGELKKTATTSTVINYSLTTGGEPPDDPEIYRTAAAQDVIDAGKLSKAAQAAKTAEMTQPVGIDANGQLFVPPGGGGGGMLPQVIITAPATTIVTAVMGSDTVSVTVGAGDTATLEIPKYGEWTLTAVYDGEDVAKVLNVDTVKQYELTFKFGNIYGVEWSRVSSPVWSRTDDAELFEDPVPYMAGMSEGEYGSPFDNIMPWKGMTRVTDETVGELVAIPKFYYKWTNDATKMKLQISQKQQVGFHVSPAHMDRGDGKGERDVVYVGRYHCATSDYKSRGGEKPKADITRATARSAISNLGADIWQLDHAMWWTIDMLYLVEFANPNCQGTIGYGRGNGSSTENMGYTDTMPYHTGSTLASKTAYGVSTQYRNIEGLWDNVVNWCDGIYFNGVNVYHIINPANFSDTTGGTLTGSRATVDGRVITGFTFPALEGFEWAGYPSDADIGSATTTGSDYFCDNEYYAANSVVLRVGGYYAQSQNSGLFCRDGYNKESVASALIGARLQKLP